MTKKEQYLEALSAFVRQRSGMQFADYGDVASYRAEQRTITRQRHDYFELHRLVSLTSADPADGVRAFSGRLKFEETPKGIAVDYCTGQYFATEYRAAACAVLAQALWDYWRKSAPEGAGGDYIRKQARINLSAGVAKRWFR